MHSKTHQQPDWYLLPLSGSSTTELQQKSTALTRYVQQYPYQTLPQIAASLCQETTHLPLRQAVLVNDVTYLAEQLARAEVRQSSRDSTSTSPPVIFMFPGIGDHYANMARGLYTRLPFFREVLDRCDAVLRPFLHESLIDLLYRDEAAPQPGNGATPGLDLAAMLGRKTAAPATNPVEARLQETIIAHPLVFSVEYALARQLQAWGLQPQGLIGYSLGEYVAAALAGVLELEAALTLVARRAELIQALPGGKMLTVPLSREAVAPYLSEHVSLSAHNGEALTVLAGEADAILDVQQQLLAQQIACRLLDTTHAFHSHMMDTAVPHLNQLARTVTYAAPQIPYLSNVTGTWITPQQATDPTYWARHMCQPVQFYSMLQNLFHQAPMRHLVEVGPGQSLGAFARQHPLCKHEQFAWIYPTLRYSYDNQDDHWFLLSTIRKLWLSGVDLQWQTINPAAPAHLPEAADTPQFFATPQHNPERAMEQKERGEKRRQNRMRRRDHSK
ncbi:MAG: acyltransferase domain-containing protein [Anaerolineaceae bacterium]|nr:acyltransferase domain-containing protein [Anaerolineaceae bacterium]